MMTALVQIAVCENSSATKPVELPLPLSHASLLGAARKKFKSVSKQSRLYDGVSGSEIVAGATDVALAPGGKLVCSGKAGWKGSERLCAEFTAKASCQSEGGDGDGSVPPVGSSEGERGAGGAAGPAYALWASPKAEERAKVPPQQLQLVSFSFDRGPPPDTAVNLDARVIHTPGRVDHGLSGLQRQVAREILATPKAAELCELIAQEAIAQLQLLAKAGGQEAPSRLRLGIGCDRGRQRSVCLAEAATAQLSRKVEKARSGRNRPGQEALFKGVEVLTAEHRELGERSYGAD